MKVHILVILFASIFSGTALAVPADMASACSAANRVCENGDTVVCILSGTDEALVSVQTRGLEQRFPYVFSSVGDEGYYSGPGFQLAVDHSSNSGRLILSSPELDESLRCN